MPQNLIRAIAPESAGASAEVRLLSGGRDLAALARLYRIPLQVDRDARRAHPGDQARARAGHRSRGRRRGRRHRHGPAHAGHRRHRRLSGLHVHPRPHLGMGVGVYKFTNLDLQSTCVFTNSTSVAAYRGAGRPEATFYLERLMDLIADEVGLARTRSGARTSFRRARFRTRPSRASTTTPASTRAARPRRWSSPATQSSRRSRRSLAAPGPELLGIGLSSYVEMCGFGPWESAVVRVEPGGKVTTYTGISAHGQGHETTFAQLAADHIGADFDKVVVHHGDTATHRTATAPAAAGAWRSAARPMRARSRCRPRRGASRRTCWRRRSRTSSSTDGSYRVKGVPAKALTLAAIAAGAYGEGLPDGIDAGLESTDFFRPAALLSVRHPRRGGGSLSRDRQVSVRDFISVDDCGVPSARCS